MHFRLFTIIIVAAGTVHFCYGQTNDNQKIIEKRIYIPKYDSNPPPLNFRSITYKDGLPRGVINTFVQSDDGFIWLGILKVGIVRFDGYHFKIFNPILKGTIALFDDYIFQIEKSHKKGLWIASVSGVIWFDFLNYKTTIIPLPPGLWRVFYHLFEDSQQRLWAYWDDQIYLFNPSTGKFTEIKNRIATNAFTGKKINIEKARFYYMQESVKGDLFLGGNTILKFNPVSYEFTLYKDIDNQVPYSTLVFDEDDENIWLSGWQGLLKFNLRNDNRSLFDFEKTGSQKEIENHSFVSAKSRTQLWLPNDQQIRVFDKNTEKVTLYKKDISANLLVTRTHEEGINGIDWFWSYKNGFSCLLPAINRFVYRKLLPEGERVICQWHDQKNNTIWYGTEERGLRPHLYKYDKSTDKIIQVEIPVRDQGDLRFIIPLQNDICLLAFADIILSNKKNSVYSKLFLLNTQTNKLTYFTRSMVNHPGCTTDSLKYRNTFPDKDGDYWITTEGNGLVHFVTKTLQFFQYVSKPKDSTTLTSNFVYSVACGKDNTIWTGSDYELDSVLNELHVATGKVQRIPLFPYNYRVQPLCEDKKGNVWISTNSGLVCYNRYSGEKYKVKEIPELITRAYLDSNGNIIALAQDGLWFYDPVKKIARRFDELDGIRLEYFEDDYISKRICMYRDSIFISDSYRFPVRDLYPQKESSPLHFTSIKILGKEWAATGNIDAVDTLTLNHDENQISFEFACLSFLSPERNMYACELQGTDTSWQQLGSNNSITYANLSPGHYAFKVKTANLDGIWGEERTLYIHIIPAFWQTVWFKALILFLIASFFYWLYRNRLHQVTLKNQLQKEHLEKEKKEAEFKRKLSEIELTALRSQMNPHFIFNCLNSIKLYAIENDSLAASEYLTKFSRLMRLVLENSRKDKVELQSELESLRLYIEMESMRFKEKLKYVIIENVDTSYTEIPPLLIQPYVENAIWHGLMHKETGGNLSIVVDRAEEDSLIRITITDDGVGRKKAWELKSKSAIIQKSFGMKVTSERIALINQMFNTNTTVEIIDLFQSDGESAGTQVIIQIPV